MELGAFGIRRFLNELALERAGFDNKLQQKVKHRNRKMGLKVVIEVLASKART